MFFDFCRSSGYNAIFFIKSTIHDRTHSYNTIRRNNRFIQKNDFLSYPCSIMQNNI